MPEILEVESLIEPYSARDDFGRRPIDETVQFDRHFMTSNELDLLKLELKQFADGRLAGRSFLISGERGIGKTTSVKLAIRHGGENLLPIFIHGPSLFSDRFLHAAKSKQENNTKPAEHKCHWITKTCQDRSSRDATSEETGSSGPPEENDPKKDLLLPLFQELYRALADRIYVGIRDLETTSLSDSQKAHLLERFRLTLDTLPNLRELRGLWQQLGLSERPLFNHTRDERFRLPDIQASLAEMMTLFRSTELFASVVIGKLESKEKNKIESAKQSKSSFALAFDGTSLNNTVTSIFAALTVGGAGAIADIGTDSAILLGSIIGLLSLTMANWSVSRQKEQRDELEREFVRDTSLRSLIREFPRILRHVRDLGLAPVFVIDELDKVDELEKVMTLFMKFFKEIGSEYAVFVFISDQSYYAKIEHACRSSHRAPESTYFSERFLLLYDAVASHKNLEDRISLREP